MGHVARTRPGQFRRAVAGSVVLHVALAVAVVLWVRSGSTKPASAEQPGFDTRADEVTLRITSAEVSIPAAPEEPGDVSPPLAEDRSPAENTSRPPLAVTVPNALSADVIARIRRPTGRTDPNVKPASGVVAAPIHGAMRAGQAVVYVLDCSGSMGEFGKFDAARAALVATLRNQPGSVRFQVIAYNSTARPVLPGGCVAASPANVAAAEAALAGLTAAGKSNHAEAVRAAAALCPDAILILTDAGDLPAAGKPVPVCVARVSAAGVAAPRELR